MINLVIISSESQLRESILILLHNRFPQIKTISKAQTVAEGIELIHTQQPDIVILDIELPDGNGFQILRNCKHLSFKSIIITTINKYAHKAIKYGAIDYLLRPVNKEELCHAINEAIVRIIQELHEVLPLNMKQHPLAENKEERIIVKTHQNHYVITVSDIEYIYNENNTTMLYIHGREQIMSPKSITDYEIQLRGTAFIRAHAFYLVNLMYIDKVDIVDGDFIVLKNGTKIPVSEPYKQTFFNAISHLS